MREPDWMLASVVVLGFIALVLACVYESTYDARHCASDDARRAGVGLWHLSCLISAVPVLFILTGSVTEAFELKDERVGSDCGPRWEQLHLRTYRWVFVHGNRWCER